MPTVALFRNKSDGWSTLSNLVRERRPFTNSTRHFRGVTSVELGWDISGRLSEPDRSAFETAAAMRTLDYAIYSYGTPIAWHTPTGWTVPDTKYSATTTGHQALVQAAIELDRPAAGYLGEGEICQAMGLA
jgi:hypothetical protein